MGAKQEASELLSESRTKCTDLEAKVSHLQTELERQRRDYEHQMDHREMAAELERHRAVQREREVGKERRANVRTESIISNNRSTHPAC